MHEVTASVWRDFGSGDERFRAECRCGWVAQFNTYEEVREHAKRHEFEQRMGTARVDCFMCGDKLPVKLTTAMYNPNSPELRYVCEACTTIQRRVDPAELIGDLLALEAELR